MTKFSLVASVVLGAFVLAGCASGVMPAVTNVAVPSAEAKNGESTCRWIFGFRVQGCSIDDAIKKAGVTQVQTLNIEAFNFLYLYQSQTISARGK